MIRKTAALAAACLWCSAACGADGAAIEIGYGDVRTSMLRIAVQDRWKSDPLRGNGWRLAGYWDFSVALWDNSDESTADLGITPVFRYESPRFYIEAAIGAHLVQRRISAHRVFSTAFQFGDHIGIGMRWRDYDVGIAFQHLSNANIRHPNPGMEFMLVRLQYYLR